MFQNFTLQTQYAYSVHLDRKIFAVYAVFPPQRLTKSSLLCINNKTKRLLPHAAVLLLWVKIYGWCFK